RAPRRSRWSACSAWFPSRGNHRLETTLASGERGVFSKRAGRLPRPGEGEAAGQGKLVRSGRMGGAIGGRREPVGASEAGRERADAAQANRHADVRDRVVGVAQERGGPLQAAGQQVLVRRLPEGAAELAAEVGRREVGRPRERL